MTRDLPWNLIKQTGVKYGVNPNFLASLIWVESRGNTYAIRYESHWSHSFKTAEFSVMCGITKNTEEVLQKCSIGLMQVMGTVARELGHKGNLLELTRPEIGIKYGAMYAKKKLTRYTVLRDAVAAYNTGIPRKEDGKYINAKYVNDVLSKFEEFIELNKEV